MHFIYARSHADDTSVGDGSSGSVGGQASPDEHEITTNNKQEDHDSSVSLHC
ncbi:hypothetical protein DPMN_018722 [Dreissena polymorpha]|uniref:Uncharacterized protein n=1 Tax=Dreissena polymorpha TaxID=45954 RepID=A0A9D4RS91_DREPO|nr:hypothetical protein DPMN_188990 [Dreissena polymorpha]KAH3879706.1 hypothetical protein DPMN_003612 [Dreissena polymorpha]KAH3894564.1 hypothetical protein DPMN_018722 [Dreissena polymorpha]